MFLFSLFQGHLQNRSGDSATDQKGAIEEVTPQEGQFVSQMFLVPKKDGTYRPVFNLKSLSVHLCKEHFKMEGLSTLKELIQEGDWMCTIDLKDGYLSVPVAREHQ